MGVIDLETLELAPELLQRVCDPEVLVESGSDEGAPESCGIVGQDRAVEAVRFGLGIRSLGFNIFVTGPTGSGRRTIIRRLVEEQARAKPVPDDWLYVLSFSDPGQPKALRLPAGRGRQFRAHMDRFSTVLPERLSQAFDSDRYDQAREELEQQYRTLERESLAAVEYAAQSRDCALVRAPTGLYVAPVRNGELLSPEAISQLNPGERARIQQALDELEDMLDDVLRRLRDHERRLQSDIDNLDREVADAALMPLLDELRASYADQPAVLTYLEELRQDVLEHVSWFQSSDGELREIKGASLLEVPTSKRYRANLLVDNSSLEGAPVVIVDRPTLDRMFGAVEYDVRYGVSVTDHTLIRAGALHQANGGYLIVDAIALLSHYDVWVGLRQALARSALQIETHDEQRLVRTVTPRPEAIPLEVKVVLIGSAEVLYALYSLDPDFGKYFKVQVDFHTEMDRTLETERAYQRFIRALTSREHLLPFAPAAAARVVEYGARLVEHQDRLSTQFGQIADLVREACYWAAEAGHTEVCREDVVTALHQQRRRVGLLEELSLRAILEDRLIVVTDGVVVGQVNALTVVSYGNLTYGEPTRVTARAYVGRGSVVDIQREIDLGGPLHSKGVLTLTGYFGGQYGASGPLSMEASLSFEQLYNDIEGDSASCAELYALISAVGEIPLRQDLAVTGAVDQCGHVMAIGGVNEKIEGFFEVCKARGLTGTQGVIIPKANVKSLMLDDTVVDAVRGGMFHIYAVSSVDEGITLLTGLPAGARDHSGRFPEDSVHGRVARRLKAFAESDRAGEAAEDEEERRAR